MKLWKTIFSLGIILILSQESSFVLGQETAERYPFVGMRSQYGFIIKHSKSLEKIANSNPWGVEIDFGWHHSSERTWQYCFCYPRSGFMLSYYNFSNPEVLGNGYGITPYIEPFLSADRNLSVSWRGGLGLIYLNNVYHPVNNPTNQFFSTPISFLAMVSINLNYRIDDKLNVKISGYYNHISNGSVKQPNKGINYPMASIGIDYLFDQPTFPLRKKEDYSIVDRKESTIRFSPLFTLKEISKEDGKQFPVFGFASNYSYLVGRMSALSAGVDWVWDGSVSELIKQQELENKNPNRLALTFGHELLIGKVNFYQQLGVYLYSPYKAIDPVYQRYGIEYFIKPKLSFGLNLKAHRHVADFIDFRVTFSI